MKLNEILTDLTKVDATVSLKVSGCKLFPFAPPNLRLRLNATKGYFNICLDHLIVLIIDLRNSNGTWRNTDYEIQYDSKDRITLLRFLNYEIQFRYESN
jgi:hypothetical protein